MHMGCHLTKIYVGGINSAETCKKIYSQAWTTPKEAVARFPRTKRRPVP